MTAPLAPYKGYLWMLLLPGLTSAKVERAARDAGLCKVTEIDGRQIELWPKLGEMGAGQWSALRKRCEELCA